MPPSKHHNNSVSRPNGAKSRQPTGTAQEAVGPSPGAHLSPDARGNKPRKNSRGPAPPRAILTTSDACGNLPQKNTRTPVPVRQGRSRRGRPDPQNRDGSGNAGIAEGSLPRLAPDGQGFEQEILLLRSMINRLLSRRPLNHTYISRYMRLLIQAQSAQAKAPKELTDEQEVDSLIKKHFHKEVDDGKTSYYDLLPVRTARPGDKWWPWRQLVSIDERRRDGLIGPDDRWPREADEYLDQKAAHEAEKAAFDAEMFRDIEAVVEGMFANDPVLSLLQDPDPQSPDPDGDDYDPDDNPNPSGGAARAEALEACPEPSRRVRAGGGPRLDLPTPYKEDDYYPGPDDDDGPPPDSDTLPSPVGVPLVGTLDTTRADSIPSPVGATGRSPDWPDPNPPTKSKSPRTARGRPP